MTGILGLSGISNLGNTCYINSCLQILVHLNILNNIFNNKIFNDLPETTFVIEYINLKNMLLETNCVISPNRFIKYMKDIALIKNKELFTDYSQNDVCEFLAFIIDCFHNSIKRNVKYDIKGESKNKTDELAIKAYEKLKELYSNDYSEIIDLFYGVSLSQLKSLHDYQDLSITCETFCNLSLPIPEDKNVCTIFDCFDLFTQNELLTGTNSWFNENTNKKQDVYKTIMFWSLPNILIIELKRFNNYNKKINTLVNSPINNLDLSRYIIGYNKSQYVYDLIGVINHTGECYGGHYNSIIKNTNNWYLYDDDVVNIINNEKIITKKSYCFFYKLQKF